MSKYHTYRNEYVTITYMCDICSVSTLYTFLAIDDEHRTFLPPKWINPAEGCYACSNLSCAFELHLSLFREEYRPEP